MTESGERRDGPFRSVFIAQNRHLPLQVPVALFPVCFRFAGCVRRPGFRTAVRFVG